MPTADTMTTDNDLNLLRFSLVFVWLFTAAASVWELQGQSAQLVSLAGIANPALTRAVILAGAAVDVVLGLLLWLRPVRAVFLAALGMMLLMTLIATAIEPAWWLHPLGPLTKNLPIAAALWVLARKRA
ncbi:DoxX-like family protein [Variovorax sp. RT4R15]|uniref:DoxX-like family protein n=1 Tax=Variovorax sp. RT4R15 TaxID=3443737 RepID=UPI003F47A3DD